MNGKATTDFGQAGTAVSTPPATVAVLTAEYTALREEIGRHQDHRNQLFSIALAIMAAVIGLAGAESHAGKQASNASIIFLLAPLLFVFLGSAYIDRGRRMLDVATYVNTWLRRQISDSLGIEVWLWETFKKAHYDKSDGVARSIAMGFDGLRGMIFVLCGAISLGVYVALPTRLSGFGRVTLFGLDVALLLTLTLFIWLFEETRGLPDMVVGAMASETDARESGHLREAIRRHVHGRYPGPDELRSAAGLAVSRGAQKDSRT